MTASTTLTRLAALALTGALALPAVAQTADKALRMILPMAAGSVGDSVARGLSGPLSRGLNRPVMVENLPGTGGMAGTTQLARAAGDGATLALVSSSHVINPFIFKSMPYDAIKDVTPITVIGKSMMVLVVHPAVPAQTAAEFIQLLQANPDKFNYGSSGIGGVTHLPAAMLAREAQVRANHVPYKGLAPQVTDTIGGQVQFGFVPVGVAAPQVKAGKLRALAVTGTSRSPLLPQIPTLIETGLRSYIYDPWLAIIGPAGLSASQVKSLYGEIRTALDQPDVRRLMDAQDLTPITMSPAETAEFFQSELAKYGALVKYAGATAE